MEERLEVGQIQEQPGPQEGGEDGGEAEFQDHGPIGVAAQQPAFEEIVQGVDHRGEGDGQVDGEKQGHDRQQQGAQAEPGEQGQTGGQERGQTDDKIVHFPIPPLPGSRCGNPALNWQNRRNSLIF